MAFARWDPIHDLLAIQQKLDRYAPGLSGWTPAVDIQETPDQYIVTAEVPGMSRDDLDIRVHDGRVTIAGVRRERPRQCEQYHRVERGHGRFSRAFLLPEPIDVEAVSADLQDGLLTITIPKAGGRGARRVDVA